MPLTVQLLSVPPCAPPPELPDMTQLVATALDDWHCSPPEPLVKVKPERLPPLVK